MDDINTIKEDKRGHDRLPFRMKVDYATVDEFVVDYTENISRGGAFIKTRRPLSPGTRLQVELNVAGVPRSCFTSVLNSRFVFVISSYTSQAWNFGVYYRNLIYKNLSSKVNFTTRLSQF